MASCRSASRRQPEGSMKGFGAPGLSLAYFSAMPYSEGWSPSGTSQGSVRTTAKEWLSSSTTGGRQHGGRAQAGVEDDLVSLAGFGYGHSPSGGAAGVASGKTRSEICVAEHK